MLLCESSHRLCFSAYPLSTSDCKTDMYVSVFQPLQFVAAFYVLNTPAVRHNSEQFYRAVVQGLRDALVNAISEIKSLKDENISLKTQTGQLRNSQIKVRQLQEDLKEKEEALQRARKTACLETLDMLARTSEQWRSRCDALEQSLASTTNQLQVRCLRPSLYFTVITCCLFQVK